MSGVKRRAVRARSARWPWFIALLAAALLLAALLARLQREETALPEIAHAQSAVLLDRETSEIASLTVRQADGAGYTLFQDEAGWHMDGQEGFVFRDVFLTPVVENAAYLEAADTLLDLSAQTALTEADFGLTEACLRVSVLFRDGTSAAFRIGDPIPGETPMYYLLLEGDRHVYAVALDVQEAYGVPARSLYAVADPALDATLIDRVSFTGENAFTLERREDGWYVVSPLVYPCAQEAVDEFLEKLEGIRFAAYAAPAAEGGRYGLDPPRRTMEVRIAPSVVSGYDENGEKIAERALDAYELTFEIGADESELVFYCRYRDDVYTATRITNGFLLTQSPDTLYSTALFRTPLEQLTALTWQDTVYEIALHERVLANNELERDEDGNVVCDVAVTRDGAAADGEVFARAYGALLSLRAGGRLPEDAALPAQPRLTATLWRGETPLTVAFYPFDALREAAVLDGTALFYVERGWDAGLVWP